MMKQIEFIGNIQLGEAPTGGGAQVRNQLFLEHLKLRFKSITYYDTWNKNRLKAFIIIIYRILFSRNKNIILSLSFKGVYELAKVLTKFRIKRDIYYWVIGGDIADHLRSLEEDSKKNLYCFNKIIVQANYIAMDLQKLGINNLKVVPNFKKIPKILKTQEFNSKLRFVYLSRFIEEKGIGLIIKVANELGESNYEIDFYGVPTNDYSIEYFDNLKLQNLHYKGFLNLESKLGYTVLANYDVMLFPTFFEGEGFPGVLIDSFIAGLPVITTDFHANPEIIKNGKNGILIEPNNFSSLKDAMNNFIKRNYDIGYMKAEAKKNAQLYSVENILNDQLFKELGLLN